jgi:hypothetical protein
MPLFAVFFADGAGFGIEVEQAQGITRAQHPTGRLSYSTARTVTSCWPPGSEGMGELVGTPASHHPVEPIGRAKANAERARQRLPMVA